MGSVEEGHSIVWRPRPEDVARSRLRHFMDRHGIVTLEELHRRSTEDYEWFWDAVVEDLGLEWYAPYDKVVDLSSGIPWARWFVGGKYNYVHDALDKHARGTLRAKHAVIAEGEDGMVRRQSYEELLAETNRLANALRGMGVVRGDRVAIFMPLIAETAIATLACSKIGAIFVPIFSGYGPQAVASRLKDAEVKVIITADGFSRRGQIVPMKETADAAVDEAPSIEKVIVVRRIGRELALRSGREVWWHDCLADQPAECETARTDGEEPYMIIYTSGTTGRPKGAVHTHNGFPIKGAQDMAHCFDVHEDDVLFWVTDLGWMMGPWAISGTLMLGATVFLYEGTPDYPTPDRLWDMIERHRVTVLGFSPTGVRSLMAHGEEWVHRHDLSSLRVLGSTGEPWNLTPYMWYFNHVGGGRCPIINYSGGTEISGGILACNPLTPIKSCAFSGPVPGMDAEVVDDQGRPVRGVVGELVIRKPWPGMTRGFWKDPGRYESTYWSRFPDVWVHGDWAFVDEDGFWYIQGRSDDTIKVAGKRLGPAEVESAAVSHPAVAEAAAIGVPDQLKGEAVVCFVVLRPNEVESEPLRKEIMSAISHQLGKALRPKAVRFVRDLPRTRNGKILRRLIRARHLALETGDLSALENPSALDEIGQAR